MNVDAAGDPRPQPPDPPDPGDCCGGCIQCVYDLHDAARERYEAALAAWLLRHSGPPVD